ncbi:MAG: tetratricopeptide (TPR) repeat protein [Myxococcota bacterium]|jgi:tetratricopeptide (TPR) repeat protein
MGHTLGELVEGLTLKSLWERVRKGKSTAVVGPRVPTPGAEEGLILIRVACDRPYGPYGPVLDALHRTADPQDASSNREAQSHGGLRNQLLGAGEAPSDLCDTLITSVNRIHETASRPVGLLFEAVDRADAGTLAVLGSMVDPERGLKAALIAQMTSLPTTGPVAALVAAIKSAGTARSLMKPKKKVVAPAEWAIADLPFDCRQILRCAAIMGPAFEVGLVAHVIRGSEATVLANLQRAADSGVRIEDPGAGYMRLSDTATKRLSDGLLPSLVSSWHGRAAAFLETQPPVASHHSRASDHRSQAGEYLAAAAQCLDTALAAAAGGANIEGLAYVAQGLELLEKAAPSAECRQLEARLLAERARLTWAAASPDGDFTLQTALQSALAAESRLESGDPARLRAEVWTITATIQYDIGADDLLEAALDRLTRAANALRDAGEKRAAARLYNDQAAVWVRIGDPLRAAELLDASRKVFSRNARTDPMAALELADTEHLSARLPLHVPARPGYEDEAISRSIDRAMTAADMYEKLKNDRGAARAFETLGRLFLLGGDAEEAGRWLTRAIEGQQQTGDVIGMARTAEAMSRLLARSGDYSGALTLLLDSLTLNVEKGAYRGIEYLETTLADLREAMDAETAASSAEMLGAVDKQLKRAKARFATAA